MKNITVPTIDQVSADNQVLFEQMKKRYGKVPNLYATMGYSDHALKAFLDLDGTISRGAFNGKQREAVALAVSQLNHCEYCLAGHTLAAQKNGLSLEETIEIRKGHSADPKINAVVQLARAMAENKGHANEAILQQFYDAGFDEAALMDLVGLIAVRVFTNYVFAATKIPVDFPGAPAID